MPKETTNDELAAMIKRGFDDTASKADFLSVKAAVKNLDGKVTGLDENVASLDTRLTSLERTTKDGFREVGARLDTIERDISDIRKHFVYRDEFEDLMARVKYLETKLSIESGK